MFFEIVFRVYLSHIFLFVKKNERNKFHPIRHGHLLTFNIHISWKNIHMHYVKVRNKIVDYDNRVNQCLLLP